MSKSHAMQEMEGLAPTFFPASRLNMIHIGNIIRKAFLHAGDTHTHKITAEALLGGNNLLRNRSRWWLKITMVGIKEEMRLKMKKRRRKA